MAGPDRFVNSSGTTSLQFVNGSIGVYLTGLYCAKLASPFGRGAPVRTLGRRGFFCGI